MNKQQKRNKDGSIGRGIEWTDFTWNPIKGCFHACQWEMPDGSIANCYAEDVANRVAQAAYPYGFEHHYWTPAVLDEPLRVKAPARIFVGSMADVFGHWVPDEQINQVLAIARAAHWHTFQFLTKNPVRAKVFDIPANCWIGASTPPDFMWNKPLTRHQQARMFSRLLSELTTLKVRGVTTWISAEPLSWDVAKLLREDDPWIGDPYQCAAFDWIVIGAASNGNQYYPPSEANVRALVDWCDGARVKVFFKGNLRSLPWAAANWREEFPLVEAAQS
jgi:protein gp37